MPAALTGVVRFPTGFAPWYVYEATLVGSPSASIKNGDILIPDGSTGAYDRLASDSAVLIGGWAYALEDYDGAQKTMQVAVVGSIIPMIALDTSMQPTCLVKVAYSSSNQWAVAASAAEFAAGKVIGRLRNHHDSAKTLRMSAANDIVIVLTGAC